MLPHAIKALGTFLEALEKLCNKHKFTFVFQGHDHVLHPTQLCTRSGKASVNITYSELQGLEFSINEENE